MQVRGVMPQLDLDALREQCPSDGDWELALRTLHIYVSRLLEHPNVLKYKRISLSNPIFHRRLGRHSAGVSCLESLGYRLDGAEGVLRYTYRDTPALLSARKCIETALCRPTHRSDASQHAAPAEVCQPKTIKLPGTDDWVADHPIFLQMQNRYLDNIATLSEKVSNVHCMCGSQSDDRLYICRWP